MQVSRRWENIISCKIIQATPLHICRQGRGKRIISCKREYFIDWRKSRYNFKENYKGNYNKFKIQLFPHVLPLSPLRLLEPRAWGLWTGRDFLGPTRSGPTNDPEDSNPSLAGKTEHGRRVCEWRRPLTRVEKQKTTRYLQHHHMISTKKD
ncbi:hypothetical protein QL285_066177 [Trifolium repens]|nr:hypothetical protein QL285_066177 [Trifolium repens]